MASYVTTFTGDGSEVHFTAGFPVLRLTDLAVVVDNVWLTMGTEFSVTGPTSAAVATLVTAPGVGAVVTLRSAVGYTPTDPAAVTTAAPTLNDTDTALWRALSEIALGNTLWLDDPVAQAEAARDAAMTNGQVYATTAAGLAATTVGAYFNVTTTGELILYLHESGPTATEVARYPTKAYVEESDGALGGRIDDVDARVFQNADGDIYQVEDGNGAVVIRVASDGRVFIPNLTQDINTAFAEVADLVGQDTGDEILVLEDSTGKRCMIIDSAGNAYFAGVGQSLTQELAELSSRIDAIDPTVDPGAGAAAIQRMTTVAKSGATWTGYTQSGGWTLAGGVYSSPTPNNTNYVQAPALNMADRQYAFAKFTLTSADAVVRLGKKSPIYNGSLMELNAGTGVVTAYQSLLANLPTVPSAYDTESLTASSGDVITMEILRQDSSGNSTIIFTVSNVTTGRKAKITVTSGYGTSITSTPCGKGNGYAFVNVGTGSATLSALNSYNVYPASVSAIILGDSFVEGNSVIDLAGADGRIGLDIRWAARIRDAISSDVDSRYRTESNIVISGMGGQDATGGVTQAIGDIIPFKAKKVVIALGTNDSVFATWQSKILEIVAKVVATGAEPILVTLAPRADRQSFIDAANAYVRSQPYRYVDFNEVLTGGTGDTWVSDLVLADNVHPSALGHEAMFIRFVADIPDILE